MKKNISRRNFVLSSSAALAYSAFSPKLFAESTAAPYRNVVSIFLRGGHDALSMSAPKNLQLLKSKRPDIQYGMQDVGDSFFGINSTIWNSMKGLYEGGDMAIIHGVGGMNPTTSHFSQMAFIEGGHSRQVLGEGFLARVPNFLTNQNLFALESSVPDMLKSDKYVLQFEKKSLLSSFKKLDSSQKLALSRKNFLESFFSWGTPDTGRATASSHNQNAENVYNKIKSLSLASRYSNKNIGLLSEMLSSGNRGLYTLSVGGWDHHVNVKSVFGGMCNSLFNDLSKLAQDLKASNMWNNTIVIIHSEFGRRIGQNGSLGVDHGRGGVAYVLGGRVKGNKIYKSTAYVNDLKAKLNTAEENPKLNLDVDIDIRAVYAEAFRRMYGLNNEELVSIFGNDETFDPTKRVWYIS